MNISIKNAVLGVVNIIAFILSIIPFNLRRLLFKSMFVVESRISNKKNALSNLFLIYDDLDLIINETATRYGEGEHPKHSLTKYHDFFVDNILPGSTVLDIGCGYGAVSSSIADRVDDVSVVGIDLDANKIKQAIEFNSRKNIKYICADATKESIKDKCEIIVLSNVLEHIGNRVEFLASLRKIYSPKLCLIRVPHFDRHWHIPMREALGINYFSDPTHYIEHTLDEFSTEVELSGYAIQEHKLVWGEIWAVCKPQK